jgi:hypothetical protein
MSDQPSDDDALWTEWLREAESPRPEMSAQFRDRLRCVVLAEADRLARPAAKKLAVVFSAAAGIAAIVFVAVVLLIQRPAMTWAEVIGAVREKPWVHGKIVDPPGHSGEMWFSAGRQIVAHTEEGSVIFDDLAQGVRAEYDPKKKVIVRTSLSELLKQDARSFQGVFAAILRGETKLGSPFAGAHASDLNQTMRRVDEGGRQWLEYELNVDFGIVSHRIVFRVDPQARLPVSMDLTLLKSDGKKVDEQPEQIKIAFDYPDDGPADIFALGVPRTTPVDDRVPTGDLARIVAGVRAGRTRFPTRYVAVVTNTSCLPNEERLGYPYLVFRDGDRWRRECGVFHTRKEAEELMLKPSVLPPDQAKAVAWWRTRVHFKPMEFCDGKAIYCESAKSKAGSEWKLIDKVARGSGLGYLHTEFMPGLIGYRLTEGAPEMRVELDAHPKESPSGAILVTAHYSGRDLHRPQTLRYWIDPARSYLTVREDVLYSKVPAGAKSQPPRDQIRVVEQAAQTPNGIWYPTVIRDKGHWDFDNSKTYRHDDVWRYYLDFGADIPEAVFQPVTRSKQGRE